MGSIIFRADASSDIGGGHIYRCLTLAGAIKQQQPEIHIEFFTHATKGDLNHLIVAQGYTVSHLTEATNSTQLIELLKSHINQQGAIDWLIVDHYQINIHWQRQLAPLCQRLMVIDDLANRAHHCDLLFDQSLDRKASDYLPWLDKPQCQIICGANHALLRPEFSQWRAAAIKKRQQTTDINRVLIAISATDPTNETGKIINQLEQTTQFKHWQFKVILTSQAKHLHSVEQQIQHSSLNIELALDVSNMAEQIYHSDIAIAAAGGAMLERCSLGLPSLVICIVDNQKHIAENLKKHQAAIAVLDSEEISQKLISALADFNHQPEQYQSIATNALQLCRGDGADKLAQTMLARIPTPSLWLKPVNTDDCQIIYQWQCEPQTRQFSRNPQPPTWQQHQAWFEKVLQDSNIDFYLIMQGDIPSGFIRLNPKNSSDKESNNKEVSIALAPSAYGQGLGHQALKLVKQLHRQHQLFAYIDDNNTPSIKAFKKAGYQAIGDGWYQQQ